MKKGIILVSIIMSVLLTGCGVKDSGKSNFDYPDVDENQTLFNNDGYGYDGSVLLFKLNPSYNYINEEDTGMVTDLYNVNLPHFDNFKNIFSEFNQDVATVTQFQEKQRQSIAQLSNLTPYNNNNVYKSDMGNGEKDFFILIENLETGDTITVSKDDGTLQKKYEGRYCKVYYTDSLNSDYATRIELGSELQKGGLFKKVADKFDSLYELETKYFGSNIYSVSENSIYANTDPKVNIMIMDINKDAVESTENAVTYGFYAPYDLSKGPKSNQAQILYLDSYMLSKNTNSIFSTIVHEFNHMLNDIVKVVKTNRRNSIDTWYTEMLSMLAEDMFAHYLDIPFGSTPKVRMIDFENCYYLGFKNWFDGNAVLYSYCNSFAYGSYLVRNYGGIEFLKKVALNSYANEASIENALKLSDSSMTFTKSLIDYYKATWNTSSYGKTFNRAIPYNSEGLGFDALNLQYFATRIDTGEIIDVRPGLADPDQQLELFPYGCTIHYIGENLEYFVLDNPSNKDIITFAECYYVE